MPKVAIVIPARYASTRLPGKPLHLIAGKPLIQHVWERCRRARGIARVIVATDDTRIAAVGRSFGAEVTMTSASHRSGTDRVAEVAKKLRGYSHIINVQGDEPLVDPGTVSRLAAAMTRDAGIGMITSASRFASEDDAANPNTVKVVLDRESNGLYFSRWPIPYVRQGGKRERPPFYLHHGIYGYSMKVLLQFVRWKPGVLEQAESLEQLRALENGLKIRVVLVKHAALGVDTPEDAGAVERLLMSGRKRAASSATAKTGGTRRVPLRRSSAKRAGARQRADRPGRFSFKINPPLKIVS